MRYTCHTTCIGKQSNRKHRRNRTIINTARINNAITAEKVLVIDEDNKQRGIMQLNDALILAEDAGLDLVEVSPQSEPPVCRVMDFGKFRFQQQKNERETAKKQKTQEIKEIKLRPKIGINDLEWKIRSATDFLKHGYKVKISLFFKGREISYLENGRAVINKMVSSVQEYGKVETPPRMDGNVMRVVLIPNK